MPEIKLKIVFLYTRSLYFDRCLMVRWRFQVDGDWNTPDGIHNNGPGSNIQYYLLEYQESQATSWVVDLRVESQTYQGFPGQRNVGFFMY